MVRVAPLPIATPTELVPVRPAMLSLLLTFTPPVDERAMMLLGEKSPLTVSGSCRH